MNADAARLAILRQEVETAVANYVASKHPGHLVMGYAFVVQTVDDNLAADSRTQIDMLVADGQSFVTTRGLLEYAIEWESRRVFRD